MAESGKLIWIWTVPDLQLWYKNVFFLKFQIFLIIIWNKNVCGSLSDFLLPCKNNVCYSMGGGGNRSRNS